MTSGRYQIWARGELWRYAESREEAVDVACRYLGFDVDAHNGPLTYEVRDADQMVLARVSLIDGEQRVENVAAG